MFMFSVPARFIILLEISRQFFYLVQSLWKCSRIRPEPISRRPCNHARCPPGAWITAAWSACSVTCGKVQATVCDREQDSTGADLLADCYQGAPVSLTFFFGTKQNAKRSYFLPSRTKTNKFNLTYSLKLFFGSKRNAKRSHLAPSRTKTNTNGAP